MTATNHSLTGAFIATVIPVPIVAIPLALLSHLVLDVLPHYGEQDVDFGARKFNVILWTDAIGFAIVLCMVLFFWPEYHLLVAGCAFLAAAPDLLSIPRYIAALKHQAYHPPRLMRFLSWIQWGERPWGWIVELVWAAAMIVLLVWLI